MRIKGIKIRGIPFFSTIIITVVFFLIAFSYFEIEVNSNLFIAILLVGAISGGFVSMWKKGIVHQGHFSIVVGIIAIATSLTFLFGIGSFSYLDENGEINRYENLWSFTPQESGVFILVGVLGFLSLVSGVREAMGSQYLWGIKR